MTSPSDPSVIIFRRGMTRLSEDRFFEKATNWLHAANLDHFDPAPIRPIALANAAGFELGYSHSHYDWLTDFDHKRFVIPDTRTADDWSYIWEEFGHRGVEPRGAGLRHAAGPDGNLLEKAAVRYGQMLFDSEPRYRWVLDEYPRRIATISTVLDRPAKLVRYRLYEILGPHWRKIVRDDGPIYKPKPGLTMQTPLFE